MICLNNVCSQLCIVRITSLEEQRSTICMVLTGNTCRVGPAPEKALEVARAYEALEVASADLALEVASADDGGGYCR
jgi:hypothetical protein